MATDRSARNRRNSNMSKRAPAGLVERLETRDLMAFVVGPVVAAEEQSFQGLVARFDAADVAGNSPETTRATITWGVGTDSSPGTITARPGGGFDVTGIKTYLQPGRYQVTVTLTDTDPAGTLATAQGEAQVSPAPLAPAAVPFTAIAGRETKATLATFQDFGGKAADYTATIRWGDGDPTTPAEVVPGDNGAFSVVGTYTYPATTSGPKQATVTLVRVITGGTATVQSSGTVAGVVVSPLPGSGLPITATTGQPFSGTVATFANPDGSTAADANLFSSLIRWGDGTTSPGTVGYDTTARIFTVAGSHTYTQANTYPVEVLVVRRATGQAYGLTTTATVSNPTSVPLVGNGVPILVTANQPFSGVVAVFASRDGSAINPALFSATVRWGDGTTTAGDLTYDAAARTLSVAGANTYTQANTYPVEVLVVRRTTGEAYGITTAATVEAGMVEPLTGSGVPILTTARQPFFGRVATFTDPEGATGANSGLYSATIDWGDGSNSPGTVGYDELAETFFVIGSHSYETAGDYTVNVTVVKRTTDTEYGLTTTAKITAFRGSIDSLQSPDADGITRINTPRFTGTAEALALVRLFARKLGDTAAVPLGVTVAGSNGQWALTAPKLPDGSYAITAVVSPTTGSPFPESAVGTIVIDTVRPEVVAVRYNPRTGVVTTTIRDDRTGFNPARLTNPAGYSLIGPGRVRVGAFRVQTLPALEGSLPTDPTTVVISFRLPLRIRRGVPTLRIAPGSLTDRAGNALDRLVFRPRIAAPRPPKVR